MTYTEFKNKAFPAHKLALDPYLSRIYRFFSLPITWLLFQRNITPNQVSIAQIVIGLLGCLFIYLWAGYVGFLIGVFLLHFAYVLDCVDGELARASHQQSIPGVFLDKYAHAITMQAIFVATGGHMAAGMSDGLAAGILCLSWAASFATFNPANRLIQTVADAMLRRRQHEQYRMEHYQKTPPVAASPRVDSVATPVPTTSRKEALIEDAEKLIGNKAGALRNSGVFWLAKHSFRHVTYLFGMTILLVFELIGLPQDFVSAIWISACLAVILKESIFVYLIVNKGLIETRVAAYHSMFAQGCGPPSED